MEKWEEILVKNKWKRFITEFNKIDISKRVIFNNDELHNRLNFITEHFPNCIPSVILASLYRYSVYDSYATPGINEKKSQDCLLETASKIRDDNFYVRLAGELLVKTDHNWLVSKSNFGYEPLAILLDSLLVKYATDYDTFYEFNEKIIKDTNIDIYYILQFNKVDLILKDKSMVKGRASRARYFKKYLILRPKIFHTPLCQDLYEKRVIQNINQYVEEHGKNL